ncbi:dihydrofolate reductase family protein [Phytohabitans houttuyneae]|uniref:Riboflavin biosynthesis protein RibD n=1 Tax=Phytohabitans houttuyneae TaxID=1076126 RepID=A0A6V8KKU2_9ACTN|nr:dihydrofolate reductase family protein [Phytohabitans houttuyneae]GFJ81305.1 riboflavin biosynthesis protein RibD [Phytohabitans houttuyneae]
MGRLFLHVNVSLDGYVNDAEGQIDWHFADEEFQRYIDDLLNGIEGMVFGRVAFQELAAYWPNAGPEASAVQVRRMHELPKYVLSRTLQHTDWHNSHIIAGDPIAVISKMKQQSSGDIALFAGGGAASSAASRGVIDEYRLVVNPVLLGGGTRLFDGPIPRTAMRLTGTRQFAGGALLLTYEPTTPAE